MKLRKISKEFLFNRDFAFWSLKIDQIENFILRF
jgi:hypothetical protein